MSFILGNRSCARLAGVHPRLVRVVERAIQITEQDFEVHCGSRTLAEQRAHIAAGTSWTLNSKHLPQSDGFAHAVDLVPLVGGKLSWDWGGCYTIAAAMSAAAAEHRVQLRWGGVWDRPLTSFATTPKAARAASAAYISRRRRAGKRAAIDGPHFELM